jgi:PleD family two-component response regulator
MVLCAVEDLMFVSKLRAAAASARVELRFVRSPQAAIAEARQHQPALVILDLNADRLRPLDIVAALRADPALGGVRTVGYVSHVDGDRIAASRAAGVDEVMPRSAFAAQLRAMLDGA